MMYETLVQYDEGGNRIKPLLASDWKYEDNGQKIISSLVMPVFTTAKGFAPLM
jgi:ABC-type transport system substrate-binding protein